MNIGTVEPQTQLPKLKTGVPGLDEILQGGLPEAALYLVEGDPGSGKTTLGLQYLIQGIINGESCLYITLSESKHELCEVAQSHGWCLDQITIHEIFSSSVFTHHEQQYTFFHTAEIELTQTHKDLEELLERLKPRRIVLDSLTDLRIMAKNPLLLRRQIQALKQIAERHNSVILMLDDIVSKDYAPWQYGMDLLSVVHGVIQLNNTVTEYGSMRRCLRVIKMRGSDFDSGLNDIVIERGGLKIFARGTFLTPPVEYNIGELLYSGCAALDQMLGGGIGVGTSTLIMGQAGVGKSSLAALFVQQVVTSGLAASVFLFDETPRSYLSRAEGLHMNLEAHFKSGLLSLNKIEPSAISPGSMIARFRHAVEVQKIKIIVIDSLDGYFNALPTEKFLMNQLHNLLSYLTHHGVTTLLVTAQHGLIDQNLRDASAFPVSYLADNLILLRFFEAAGEMRRAIAVIKSRSSPHDHYIHEMAIVGGVGLQIGKPIAKFQGILTGNPTYMGPIEELLRAAGNN